MYLGKGRLPWQGLKCANKKQRYEMICERKMTVLFGDLCEGLPSEFQLYMEYTRGLSFEERPDYDLLRGMFR